MVRPIECGSGCIQQQHRVHFSPVVSQLRYREQQGCLRPVTKNQISVDNNDDQLLGHQQQDAHDNCERVRVHIQEVILPTHPTVQKVQMQKFEKVQVSIPSSSSGVNFGYNDPHPHEFTCARSVSVDNEDKSEFIMHNNKESSSYFSNGCHASTGQSVSATNKSKILQPDDYKGFFRNVINRNSKIYGSNRDESVMCQVPKVTCREDVSSKSTSFSSVVKPVKIFSGTSNDDASMAPPKKGFMKSKLSFLHRFTWGRFGGSGSSSNIKCKSSKVCVPVSTWPFKSIVPESTESPVNKSCSACVELCQIKKETRSPVVDSTHTHKVELKPRICYYRPHVNANRNGNCSRLSSCRGKVDVQEQDYQDEDEKAFVINTGYTMALKGSSSKQAKEKNLVNRNIPVTTGTVYNWQTADQSHFVPPKSPVSNEKAAVVSAIEFQARDCPCPQEIPRDKPIYSNDSETITPRDISTTTGVNYTTGSIQLTKNCTTVATSPIRHLSSSFYSLNLPIVSNRFSSSSLVSSTSSVIVDTTTASSSNSTTAATTASFIPIPKPRRKKTLETIQSQTIPAETSLDSDELSANVDKILDEIECCLKMEMNYELFHNKENETVCVNRQSNRVRADVQIIRDDHIMRHTQIPIGKPPLPPKNTVTRDEFFRRLEPDSVGSRGKSGTELDVKLLKMQLHLRRSMEELAKSHPDLEEIEDTVRNSMVIDRSRRQRTLPPLRGSRSGNPKDPPGYTTTTYGQIHRLTPDPVTIENERRTQEWSNLYNQVSENYLRSPPSHSGDLSTTINPPIVLHRFQSDNSLMSQKEKENLEDRQFSEHELRIQRSLNKLNVPEWYTKYASSNTSVGESGQSSSNKAKSLAGGWSGLSSSKTSSLTSLQSTGRTHFSRFRPGARSSRESLMSPSSTASASPSPYYERSSFTYGMPYALSRFASARMSCGASPASLSPSPSPVGGVGISSPVTSAPLSRHHSYSKAPYMGWRSQERLTSKTLYRTPAERLAADLLAQKSKAPPTSSSSVTDLPKEALKDTPPEICLSTSPKKETASDLSLNNSEESNSHKLNRVRSSIKEVSNAIVDYVNESKPLDESINGGASPRKGFVWLESSFVGIKPLDSPGTPDTPQVIMSSSSRQKVQDNSSSSVSGPRNIFRFDDEPKQRETIGAAKRTVAESTNPPSSANNDSSVANTSNGSTTTFTPYLSRNDKESPTLEDILDSLLALRRPDQKKARGHTREVQPLVQPPSQPSPAQFDPISDWQERMNQPLQDTVYFPVTDDFFPTTTNKNSNYSEVTDSFVAVNSSSSLPSHPIDNDTTVNNDANFGNFAHAFFGGNNENNEENVVDMSDILGPRDVKVSDSTSTGVELDENDLLQRHEEDMLDKEEEDAFGNAKDMFSTVNSSCNAVNVIASSLNDASSPTPTRHRRVSFDLDISDKEEKSSSRSRRDESVGGTIHCRNSKCGKTANGLEARREFKTCHNCNAYYCSRECRRADWEKKHKKVCMQSRVGALCKQIINHVKEDSYVVSQLSAVAKRGILAKGKGCVKLFFSSPVRAERFLTTVPLGGGGVSELPEPWYIPMNDILPEEMGAQTFTELSEQCRTYNGENRFVLYVSVCVVNEVPTSGAVKWEREMISRSAKLRLLLPRNYDENQMHHHAATTAHLFPSTSTTSTEVQPQVPPHLHLHQHETDSTQENIPPPLPPHGPSSSSDNQ